MSQTQIQVVGPCLPVTSCSYVTLCLGEEWAAKVLNGIPLVLAKIVAIGAVKLPLASGCYTNIVPTNPCCIQGGNLYPTQVLPTSATIDACKYTVNIENLETIFEIDPETTLPYTPVATDVLELIPYTCMFDSLFNHFEDIVSPTLVGNTLTGVLTYDTPGDPPQVINVCDLIAACAFPTFEVDSNEGTITFQKSEEATPVVANICTLARACEIVAIAQVGVGHASTGNFLPNTDQVVDFNTVLYDPLGMITTGAGWQLEVPESGRYRIHAAIRFTNTVWGHQGGGDYPAVSLYYKINGDPTVNFAVAYGPLDSTPANMAPQVSGNIVVDLDAGDTLQIIAFHTDDTQPDHGILFGPNSQFSISRL